MFPQGGELLGDHADDAGRCRMEFFGGEHDDGVHDEETCEVEGTGRLPADGGVGCGKGHRPSLAVPTSENGSICLACLSALLRDPRALTHHVSYGLSQISAALRMPGFVRALRDRHAHFLVAPLVEALVSTDEEPLASQLIAVISDLSGAAGFPPSVLGDFVSRVADLLSSGALAWSRRQVFVLHCLGVLLNKHQDANPAAHIANRAALFSTLVVGLQLPSEEIRGEILFVLYKLSLQQATPWDDDCGHDHADFSSMGERLLRLSIEALLKTQNDDVRMNCVGTCMMLVNCDPFLMPSSESMIVNAIRDVQQLCLCTSPALLMVLTQRGVFGNMLANDGEGDKLSQGDERAEESSLINMFADAVKGPLLCSDSELQISTLDLIFHLLSSDVICFKQIQVLVDESIPDYVFEILRSSGKRDALISSCLKVLNLLATVEREFAQKLAIGFPILIPVLYHVLEIPFHSVQNHAIRLVLMAIMNFPGILSTSQAEDIALVLTGAFKKHSGELNMLPETFTLICSTIVELLNSASACHTQKLISLIQEASRSALSLSLTCGESSAEIIMYSLYLLTEVFEYGCQEQSNRCCDNQELQKNIIETCETYLLPWFGKAIDEEDDEQVIMAILETFHLVLLKGSGNPARSFAQVLASSCWFSLSFGCLGLFPTEQMKRRIYMMLSLIIDGVLGIDFGQPIRDNYASLPSDPQELLYLLGLSSSQDQHLASCQNAVLVMLYASSLYDERLADPNQVLASLEQYIILNGDTFSYGVADSNMLSQVLLLYALIRGDTICWSKYSVDAEKVIFRLIAEKEWDLLCIGIHPMALKWLFKQEEIMTPLSQQILSFCRLYSTREAQISIQEINIQTLDIQMLAQLIVSRDTYISLLLVTLLVDVQESQEDDALYIVNVIIDVLSIFPEASEQFCLHGIAGAILSVYSSTQSGCITKSILLLIFNLLFLVNNSTFFNAEEWLGIVIKLLEHLNPESSAFSSGQDEHLIVAIFCLILHYSSENVLTDAAKAILLGKSLALFVENMIRKVSTEGRALGDYDEETPMGESLTFILLLYFFSLKRLMHFGSSLVKLVSSHCLLELLTRISFQRVQRKDELRCSVRYLESMLAVTESLLFFKDSTISTNCGACFSLLLGWEKFGLLEKKAIRDSKWCRLVLEELAMSLAAPGLASRSFINQHKPVVTIALALFKLDEEPSWMKSVLTGSCISTILENLSACNLTTEMVKFFRELMVRKYLNKDQIDALQQLFQVCRRQVYMEDSEKQPKEEKFGKAITDPDDKGELCSLLIQLMLLSSNTPDHEVMSDCESLLEEIDKFLHETAAQ